MDNKQTDSGQPNFGDQARKAYDATSDFAQDAVNRAKQAASDTASGMGGQVKQMLDQQIGVGADLVGLVARSARIAAEDMEQNSPQMASLVYGVADRIEGYSEGLREQDFEQILETTSDFARRQPALMFGLAALAGFLVFRTLKATPSVRAPSIQPSGEENSGQRRAGGPGRRGPSSRNSSNSGSGGSHGL